MTGAASVHPPPSPDLRNIRLLLLDVDGVMTDGLVHFDAEGREFKSFHIHDAAGLVYWNRTGGLSGFVSGRAGGSGKVVHDHAHHLGVHEVHLGCRDKAAVLDEILARRDLRPEHVAYVGDDLLDLPVLERVGFAVSVPSGRSEVQSRVHLVTRADGGRGAVREVVELLLKAQGRWDDLVRRGGRP